MVNAEHRVRVRFRQHHRALDLVFANDGTRDEQSVHAILSKYLSLADLRYTRTHGTGAN